MKNIGTVPRFRSAVLDFCASVKRAIVEVLFQLNNGISFQEVISVDFVGHGFFL